MRYLSWLVYVDPQYNRVYEKRRETINEELTDTFISATILNYYYDN